MNQILQYMLMGVGVVFLLMIACCVFGFFMEKLADTKKINELSAENERMRNDLFRVQHDLDLERIRPRTRRIVTSPRIRAKYNDLKIKADRLVLENDELKATLFNRSNEHNKRCDERDEALKSLNALQLKYDACCGDNDNLKHELDRLIKEKVTLNAPYKSLEKELNNTRYGFIVQRDELENEITRLKALLFEKTNENRAKAHEESPVKEVYSVYITGHPIFNKEEQ